MLNGFKVSDVDIHVVEPRDLWQRYIDPAFAAEAPRFAVADNPERHRLGSGMMVAGSLTSKISGNNRRSPEVGGLFRDNLEEWYSDLIQMGWTPEAQILGMDRQGVDLAFLYPTAALGMLANDDIGPELSLAIARAYNDWLNDFASDNRDRMVHIAMVPLQNPKGAIEEARRCAESFGSKGVFMRGEPLYGRILDDPVYEELWDELERLDLALGLHQGTHHRLPTLGATRFSTRFQSHTLSHPMEQMSSLVALIGSGVLERHPKLRVACLEAGGGWLPYFLWRFDEQYEQLGAIEAPSLKMKPSDYFRRQCWISVEPKEPHIKVLTDYLGEDYTVISSDFPHSDHRPGELKEFAERGDLPESVIRKTLWDNTMRFYNM